MEREFGRVTRGCVTCPIGQVLQVTGAEECSALVISGFFLCWFMSEIQSEGWFSRVPVILIVESSAPGLTRTDEFQDDPSRSLHCLESQLDS